MHCGVDLHGRNVRCFLTDENDKVVAERTFITNLSEVLIFLKPYQSQGEGIAVESTYNWYWLVDGLNDAGDRVHLANPNPIKTMAG